MSGPLVMLPSASCVTVKPLKVAMRLSLSYVTVLVGMVNGCGMGAMNSRSMRPTSSKAKSCKLSNRPSALRSSRRVICPALS